MYIPDKGDIVWLNFNPQAGSEIQKTRPALVVSPKKYNEKTNLAIFMPITSKIRGYPFEVRVTIENKESAILCDHVRSLDWKKRGISFISKIIPSTFKEAIYKLNLLING